MAQRRRGAPRKIKSAAQLERLALRYLDSISYEEPATVLRPTGELDRYGHPVMEAREQVNALGQVPMVRRWLRLPSIEELCAEVLHVAPSTWSRWASTEDLGPTCEKIKNLISIPWRQALEGQHVAGVIFNLERNFGMTAKQEVVLSGGVEDYLRALEQEGQEREF